jgi:hypothetical protein
VESTALSWSGILLVVTGIKVNCQKPKETNAKMEFKAEQILPDAIFQLPIVFCLLGCISSSNLDRIILMLIN